MKRTINYIASLVAAAGIAAIGLAPVASAAASSTPVSHPTFAPGNTSAPPPCGFKIDSPVPGEPHLYVPYFPGMLSLVS